MASASHKDLIKKRGGLKAKLTSFNNFLNLIKDLVVLSELQKSELECRLRKIDAVYDQFDALQMEIEALSEQVEDEYKERLQYEEQYYSLLALARSMMNAATSSTSSRAGSVTDDHEDSCAPKFHLPVINVPQFSGDFQEWLEFRDTYLSIIHNNNNISNVHKFHYLRAALKGTASLIIQSLDVTANNYPIAWQLLTERYDNIRLLINNHIQALVNTKNISSESSLEIRNVIDVMNKNLRALATLGEPVDHWDTIIVYVISKKLDPVTNRLWEEYRCSLSCNSPSLQQFIKFLNNKCDVLDTLNAGVTIPIIHNVKHSKLQSHPLTYNNNNYNNSFSKKELINTDKKNYNKNITCPMCSQNHFLFTCPSFIKLDVDSRIKKATESRVCMNCLRPGHVRNHCRLSNCKYCNSRHNTLLHKDNFHKDPSSSNVALSTNINSSCNTAYVILSTALVRVKDKDGK
ncbi:unnamed protein product [Parnassius mnemosyne]|uniref:CCHC-type domain-containing protein n=1 Tax=Parnassius mnemosyne TaxID=213953 RepID=A0AAV1KPJ2_9NEOP